MLVEAFARSKAPLVPMVWQTGAPSSTSMIVDCSRFLGAQTPRWSRCYASHGAPISTSHESMLVQRFVQTKASLVLMVCMTGAPEAQACA